MYVELVTMEEAGGLLLCGRNRVFELLARGELPRVRTGRRTATTREAIDAFIRRQVEAAEIDRARQGAGAQR